MLLRQDSWELGIGNVLVSRRLSSGNVGFAMFLVDVYCLGVKDVFFNILPRAVYDAKIHGSLLDQGPVEHVTPECARKLVEGAVAYARSFELPPHADYRVGRLIFGDISAESCPTQFVFGNDGKPFFCAGPNDHALRCEEILHTLERACGPDGFHYLLPVGPSLQLGQVRQCQEGEEEGTLINTNCH